MTSQSQFSEWGRLLALAQKHKTKAALRAAIADANIKISETEPHSGYYRCAAVKDGPLLPVAIWRQEGTLFVMRANASVALERVWPYCVWNPIPYEWYEGAVERNEAWPDAAPTGVAAELKDALDDHAQAQQISGTPVEDEAAKAKREIEEAVAAAKQVTSVGSEDEAGATQALRAKLNKLASDADKRRKALMYPFEQEADKIHQAWMPLVKAAKGAADGLRDGPIKAWLNRPQPQPAPIATVPTARTDGSEVPTTHNEPAAEPAMPPAAQPSATVIKGATGRAAPIRTNQVAVVTDYDALYLHAKAFPEVKTTLDRIAQRLVDAGNKDIPGVEIKEERSAA